MKSVFGGRSIVSVGARSNLFGARSGARLAERSFLRSYYGGIQFFHIGSIDQDFADRAGLVSIAANAVSAALTPSLIRVNSWLNPSWFSIEAALESIRAVPQPGLRHNAFYM